MKIPFFRQRPNTRYNYTPRYYKGKSGGKTYDIRPLFDRASYNQVDFGSQWRDTRKESRTRANRGVSRLLLLIIAILVLLFLWLIDFDLSIFTQPN